ncbi:hypothetical protein [Paractinoplanes hotanensis]|uniref:Uncharacterized protein n=1 Tax=Paractinoplanes hotanensis TaxID=2906497 RepID=A0ABT0Y9N8_9ACTN|nr:hypothetical protein [Actinoplanes hotanensis]MCM4082218.1 hypothetical protein [Actinoplanes hotanensis]
MTAAPGSRTNRYTILAAVTAVAELGVAALVTVAALPDPDTRVLMFANAAAAFSVTVTVVAAAFAACRPRCSRALASAVFGLITVHVIALGVVSVVIYLGGATVPDRVLWAVLASTVVLTAVFRFHRLRLFPEPQPRHGHPAHTFHGPGTGGPPTESAAAGNQPGMPAVATGGNWLTAVALGLLVAAAAMAVNIVLADLGVHAGLRLAVSIVMLSAAISAARRVVQRRS